MRANPLTEQPWYVQFFKGDYLRIYGHTLQQDRTDLETQFAIHALDLQPNDHVLDLCCGQGRHSIALAQNRFERHRRRPQRRNAGDCQTERR